MKELQELLQTKRKEARRLAIEIDGILTRLLAAGCDHSKDEAYTWEWDSGYGRQSNIVGRRCAYCGFIDLWSRGSFIDPSQIG